MFIQVVYKDAPELSMIRRNSSEIDLAEEKTLLVNPECYVRIMLEYIRTKCKLGIFTSFDLCDEDGGLKGLFNLPAHSYATDLFHHKRTYYIIVLRCENDRRLSVLPQLNHENRLYLELKTRVRNFMTMGELRPNTTPVTVTPQARSRSALRLRKK